MNIDFNAGKKINKISDDEEKEEIVEETSQQDDYVEETRPVSSSNNNYDKDELKKKLVKVCGIMIGIFVIFLLILLLSSLFLKQKYTYDDVEAVMKEAAISYFNDNQHQLPKEGNIVTIEDSSLIDSGYMKTLDKYLGEDTTCKGRVDVENTDGNYSYSPYLNCGNDYETIELYKKITKEGNIVTNGYGLYSSHGEYVFRGENVDNYVKLKNALWRVVKVKNDNTIQLILAEPSVIDNCYDDRYNKNVQFDAGINTYATSRVKDLLTSIYKGTEKVSGYDENDYKFVSDDDKTKMNPTEVCVGKRTENDSTKDNSSECSEKLRNQYFSLLTVSDYMNASLDNDCTSTVSKSCANFNYLADQEEWWLMTANKSNTSEAYYVEVRGEIAKENASYYAKIRPVIYLKSNVFYKSGNGSINKPYKVK